MLPERLDRREVAIAGAIERGDPREVVERLGEVFRAGLERPVEFDLLVEDLFLEERRHHDGGSPGRLDLPGGDQFTVER